MRNIDDTATYTLFDHVLSRTVRSLSHVVGLRKITQPFWARWLSSGVRPDVIFRFLDRLGSIDGWATIAADVVADERARFEASRAAMSDRERITALRELSYLANLGQWGSLPITDERRDLYRQCRDFYVEAETACFGERYAHLAVPFADMSLHANLHLPIDRPLPPLIVIVHGIDGCKEEFLSTELALLDAGFAVAGFDGPGQGETLLLDHQVWRPDFSRAISALLDRLQALGGVDADRTGLVGISVGGTWAMQAAAHDPRIAAVFDLGGPTDTLRCFPGLPFLVKTRTCQVTGCHDTASVTQALKQIRIEDETLLANVKSSVRIVHGTRDRAVAVADKEWLLATLKRLRPSRDASLRLIEGGDHCCTQHADEVRNDMLAYFVRVLRPRAASTVSVEHG